MEEDLSNELLNYYYGFLEADWLEDIAPGEREEAERTKAFSENVAKVIVLSRGRFSQGQMDQIDSIVQSNKSLFRDTLNTYYTIEELKKIPDLVRRTLQLSALTAKDTPSVQTNFYISEACRAYIHGFQSATVAMSRAALEQALKERLGRQADGEHYELRKLLDDAKKYHLLTRTGFSAAKDLAKEGDSVLHESPVKNEEAALTILSGVRSLLEEIYSADGHF